MDKKHNYTNHEMPLNKRINEVLGVCLTNDMVKKLFCFLGVTNSGKTFLLSFLMRLFNNSATVTMQPNDLGRQFAPSRSMENPSAAAWTWTPHR